MSDELVKQESEDSDGEAESLKIPIPLKEFLEEYPLNIFQRVSGYYSRNANNYLRKIAPQLRLWCSHEECGGYRRFEGSWSDVSTIGSKTIARDFLVYRCRDCDAIEKTFCIQSVAADDGGGGFMMKVGEYPEVHIDIPSYLPTLLGDEYPYFIKGLKAEKQGLGIGSFSYYRRVVENQKGRMFKSMADAAARLKMPQDVIDDLIAASKETQFKNAIDRVKDHIPEAFKVDGHNPMKVLHTVLSSLLHEGSDDECLKAAHNIRIVLQDMSQRIKDALRDDAEAQKALSALMQKKAGA